MRNVERSSPARHDGTREAFVYRKIPRGLGVKPANVDVDILVLATIAHPTDDNENIRSIEQALEDLLSPASNAFSRL